MNWDFCRKSRRTFVVVFLYPLRFTDRLPCGVGLGVERREGAWREER